MSHDTLQRAPATTAGHLPAHKTGTAAGEHLSRLFSATLSQGLLHPLYLPLLNHRSAGNVAAS